ncbi:hypothetical protein BC455_17845 [Vibrio harveyi]|uniref:hypothetical protein n=1 Tax=Vibrio harveyi TaxID=669 RepID=UPI00084151C1|nr:hypothetical protein [Vibrio harveyi]ODM56955.1 hypothetical protein BC455_17845 [Vibrio harveyi]
MMVETPFTKVETLPNGEMFRDALLSEMSFIDNEFLYAKFDAEKGLFEALTVTEAECIDRNIFPNNEYDKDRLLNKITQFDLGIGLVYEEDKLISDMLLHEHFITVASYIAIKNKDRFWEMMGSFTSYFEVDEQHGFNQSMGIMGALNRLISIFKGNEVDDELKDLDIEEWFFQQHYDLTEEISNVINDSIFAEGDRENQLSLTCKSPVLVHHDSNGYSEPFSFSLKRDEESKSDCYYIDPIHLLNAYAGQINTIEAVYWDSYDGISRNKDWMGCVSISFNKGRFGNNMPDAFFMTLDDALKHVESVLKERDEISLTLKPKPVFVEFKPKVGSSVLDLINSAFTNMKQKVVNEELIITTNYHNFQVEHERKVSKEENLQSFLKYALKPGIDEVNAWARGAVKEVVKIEGTYKLKEDGFYETDSDWTFIDHVIETDRQPIGQQLESYLEQQL